MAAAVCKGMAMEEGVVVERQLYSHAGGRRETVIMMVLLEEVEVVVVRAKGL